MSYPKIQWRQYSQSICTENVPSTLKIRHRSPTLDPPAFSTPLTWYDYALPKLGKGALSSVQYSFERLIMHQASPLRLYRLEEIHPYASNHNRRLQRIIVLMTYILPAMHPGDRDKVMPYYPPPSTLATHLSTTEYIVRLLTLPRPYNQVIRYRLTGVLCLLEDATLEGAQVVGSHGDSQVTNATVERIPTRRTSTICDSVGATIVHVFVVGAAPVNTTYGPADMLHRVRPVVERQNLKEAEEARQDFVSHRADDKDEAEEEEQVREENFGSRKLMARNTRSGLLLPKTVNQIIHRWLKEAGAFSDNFHTSGSAHASRNITTYTAKIEQQMRDLLLRFPNVGPITRVQHRNCSLPLTTALNLSAYSISLATSVCTTVPRRLHHHVKNTARETNMKTVARSIHGRSVSVTITLSTVYCVSRHPPSPRSGGP
ncbi:hypothetical protein FN846DRAFT_887327 [Sphaerosporella brunnea]|uniref:Uncharacterized protein n=1 Tax=Sphaerosporella brunnea TaxID=1250544 RepID=A0A5J5F656_9PEZI|nr:hypothetical protein FN846DRAFT_887327 [Sphaerosporella brunnea]